MINTMATVKPCGRIWAVYVGKTHVGTGMNKAECLPLKRELNKSKSKRRYVKNMIKELDKSRGIK